MEPLNKLEILGLFVAAICFAILFAAGHILTGGNFGNFQGDVVNIMLALTAIVFTAASSALMYCFRPRLARFSEKYEHVPKNKRRQHTLNLNNDVYLRLSHVFAEPNPRKQHILVYSVPDSREGSIYFTELPRWQRAEAHLRSGKSYRNIYSVWETALTKKNEFNEKHLKLRRDVKDLLVQEMKKRFSTFQEHKYPTSPDVRGYFYSEAFVNIIIYDVNSFQKYPDLKPDFDRHFTLIDWNSHDGHWQVVEYVGHKILQVRDNLTDDDVDNMMFVLMEIETNSQIRELADELYNQHGEIIDILSQFGKKIRSTLVDKINDIEGNYIVEGKCDVGY